MNKSIKIQFDFLKEDHAIAKEEISKLCSENSKLKSEIFLISKFADVIAFSCVFMLICLMWVIFK